MDIDFGSNRIFCRLQEQEFMTPLYMYQLEVIGSYKNFDGSGSKRQNIAYLKLPTQKQKDLFFQDCCSIGDSYGSYDFKPDTSKVIVYKIYVTK